MAVLGYSSRAIAEHGTLRAGLRLPEVRGVLAGAGIGGGATAGAAAAHDHRARNRAAGATAGAAGGYLAYQAPSLVHDQVGDRRKPAYMRPGVKQSELGPREKKLKRGFEGQRRRWIAAFPNATERYRHYPKSWPGAGAERTLAHTHGGRLGHTIGATSAALGAAGGYRAVRRHQVGKVLYERDRHTSIPRAAEFGAGAAAVAWGGPRLRMLTPALRAGAKAAAGHGNHRVAQALAQANAARAVLERSTANPARALRTIHAVDVAVNQVPPALRGEVATVAGALLMSHAAPVRRDRFAPARNVYGW